MKFKRFLAAALAALMVAQAAPAALAVESETVTETEIAAVAEKQSLPIKASAASVIMAQDKKGTPAYKYIRSKIVEAVVGSDAVNADEFTITYRYHLGAINYRPSLEGGWSYGLKCPAVTLGTHRVYLEFPGNDQYKAADIYADVTFVARPTAELTQKDADSTYEVPAIFSGANTIDDAATAQAVYDTVLASAQVMQADGSMMDLEAEMTGYSGEGENTVTFSIPDTRDYAGAQLTATVNVVDNRVASAISCQDADVIYTASSADMKQAVLDAVLSSDSILPKDAPASDYLIEYQPVGTIHWLPLTSYGFGSYAIRVTYLGSTAYKPSVKAGLPMCTVTVNKIPASITVGSAVITDEETIPADFVTVTPDQLETVTLFVSDKAVYVTGLGGADTTVAELLTLTAQLPCSADLASALSGVNGETPVYFTAPNGVAGKYAVTVMPNDITGLYDIQSATGTLTVRGTSSIVLTEDALTLTYGDSVEDAVLALVDREASELPADAKLTVSACSGNAGTYDITVSFAGDELNLPAQATVTVTVEPISATVTVNSAVITDEDEIPADLAVTDCESVELLTVFVSDKAIYLPQGADQADSAYLSDLLEAYDELERKTGTPVGVAGKYAVFAIPADTVNYDVATATGTLTILGTSSIFLTEDALTLTYGDSVEDAVLALVDREASELPADAKLTVSACSGNAGTYTVTVSFAGSELYTSAKATLTVKITAADVTVSFDHTDFVAGEVADIVTVSPAEADVITAYVSNEAIFVTGVEGNDVTKCGNAELAQLLADNAGLPVYFGTPANVPGRYVVTVILNDGNYAFTDGAMGTVKGNVVVRLNHSKGLKLNWNQALPGYKISAADARNFDFGATLTLDGDVSVSQQNVHVLYSGFTSRWRAYSSTTDAPTEPGRYTMTVVTLGGQVTAPLTRSFQIVK